MIIDLDNIEKQLIGRPTLELFECQLTELLRLARLGQEAERRECAACVSHFACNIQPHASCYVTTVAECANWSCGDWEKRP